MTPTLGQIVHSFFEDNLKVQRGFRPSSIRGYRDVVCLFLHFIAQKAHRPITKLSLEDLSFDRTLMFLKHLEEDRGNHIRTRNHRLAVLRTFFDYVGGRIPEMLEICQRITMIPVKRVSPPETYFLERDEVSSLFSKLPKKGRHCKRDRALFLFLYNTGARVQEVADLRVKNLELDGEPRVQLHGKGDKWRWCPLWTETATQLRNLLQNMRPDLPVFCSRPGVPLTRFGIYKIVRRHACYLDKHQTRSIRVSPHLFRHTAAVHLLESGVEVNVIRAWLGHVSLDTTNRYAEITIRAKEAAIRTCEPPSSFSGVRQGKPVWMQDESLLAWLKSL
jgi:site-specific recombinase XerD